MASKNPYSALYEGMRSCHAKHHDLLITMQQQCKQAKTVNDLHLLGSYIHVFCHELHVHHTAEDEHMFPLIARKTDISHLENQHEQLARSLVELEKLAYYLEQLVHSDDDITDVTIGATLVINEALTLVTEHERAEENVLEPDNMKRLFTEIEMKQLEFHKN